MDVFLVELDRNLNYLTTHYETFETVQKDNRRELDIKLDKHQVRLSFEQEIFFIHFIFSNYFKQFENSINKLLPFEIKHTKQD